MLKLSIETLAGWRRVVALMLSRIFLSEYCSLFAALEQAANRRAGRILYD
jgi:hypothetical protein